MFRIQLLFIAFLVLVNVPSLEVAPPNKGPTSPPRSFKSLVYKYRDLMQSKVMAAKNLITFPVDFYKSARTAMDMIEHMKPYMDYFKST